MGVPVTIRRTQCFCLNREPSRPPSWRSQTARSLSAIRSEPPAPPPAKSCSTRRITGYQEILTDPSYCQQIVTLTYPHIGNYGVNEEDVEASKVHAAGLIIRDLPLIASNFRTSHDAVSSTCSARTRSAIANIDTRKLTRMLRTKGAQNGCIVGLAAGEEVTPALVDKAVAGAPRRAQHGGPGPGQGRVRRASPTTGTQTEWQLGEGYGELENAASTTWSPSTTA